MSAYRALWQWPLRSPARLVITAAVLVALAVGIGLAAGALSGERSGPGLLAGVGDSGPNGGGPADVDAVARPPARDGAPPQPTALPPVPELAPSTLPLAQAPQAALDVAARWSAAWVRPPAGTTSEQWIEGLRELTTPEYLPVLGGVDPANVPASTVTGPPRPVRVAASSVQAEVPTDGVTLLVLVVDTGQGWRVAGHDRT